MKKFRFLFAVATAFWLSACSVKYQISTTINKDGSMYREVSIGNSDTIKLPLFFPVDSLWQINTTKISRQFAKPEDFMNIFHKDSVYHPLATPDEKLTKKSCWFYTTHTYSVTYRSIAQNFALPLNNYMSKEEQQIWLNGDYSQFQGLLGFDAQEKLNDIEEKFMKWYAEVQFDVYFNALCEAEKENGKYYDKLLSVKNKAFDLLFVKMVNEVEIKQSDITEICDSLLNLKNYFNEQSIENYLVREKLQNTSPNYIYEYSVHFSLSLPEKVTFTNAQSNDNGTLIWDINPLRFLNADYQLIAEYRTLNIWAYAVTIAVIIGLIIFAGYFFKKARCI